MFDLRRGVLDLEIWKRVRAALVANQQRVALRVISGVCGALENLDHSAIGVLAMTGRNAFGDDRALRVLADMDHLRAGVGLLIIVGQRDGVELADRVVAHAECSRDIST